MTAECAKFLIRLARQPEAAAAPQSLHGLSGTQHNKPLYSFEDNADYVRCHVVARAPRALCLRGRDGALGPLELNNDTEVSAGAGPGGLGGGAPAASLRLPLSQKRPFFGQTPLIAAVLPPTPILRCSAGIGRCIWPQII